MSDGTTNKSEGDMSLVGYLITVSEILRVEGHEAWAVNISKAASKINEMQKEIKSLRRQLEPLTTFASAESVTQLRAENEKLRAALKPFATPDWCEYATFTGHDLHRAAAALKETGDE